mmetsp:Transcript_77578/g.155446  ORF Transcript_77578/g.155446 Transcript_77578/m.155446 type:complete len:182 (+) Transcript_77578:207-752(+)
MLLKSAFCFISIQHGLGGGQLRPNSRLHAPVQASLATEMGVSGERPAVVDGASPGAQHPCVSCGACCVTHRVSFPYFEIEQKGIPEDMVQEIAFPWAAMKGTHQTENSRCVALSGSLGQFGTTCGIYDRRPQCCRDFVPSFEDGATHDERCDQSRAKVGLAALTPADWEAHNREAQGISPD